jgi:hypothetical protein
LERERKRVLGNFLVWCCSRDVVKREEGAPVDSCQLLAISGIECCERAGAGSRGSAGA